MPARLSRALQVRTADRLRASLARDEVSGLPMVGALSEQDQHDLREVGGGRLAAIVLRVEWVIDAAQYPRAIREVQSLVMREVAGRIDAHVRRTDLLGSLREDALLILASALDRPSGQSLAERLGDLLPDGRLELGDLQVQVRVRVGVASRGDASVAWTTETLAAEAERAAAADRPPIASVA